MCLGNDTLTGRCPCASWGNLSAVCVATGRARDPEPSQCLNSTSKNERPTVDSVCLCETGIHILFDLLVASRVRSLHFKFYIPTTHLYD